MAVRTDYTAQGGVRNSIGAWLWHDAQGRMHRVEGPALIKEDGSQAWYMHGERHREDGPAYCSAQGTQVWYLHGQRHRVDGPAVIDEAGSQEWWIHGQRHRTDGPAVMWPDGAWWFVQGCDITYEVATWMRDHKITLPFTPEQQAEFLLRWL